MKIIPAAVALCCTVLLAACFPPVTAHPLGGSAARSDASLAGLWKARMTEASDENNKAYFHFVPKKDGTMLVLIVSASKTDDGDVMGAMTTSAMLGSNRYLNAKLVSFEGKEAEEDEGPDGTIPVMVKRNGRHMTLYLMNEDTTKAAIKAGRIKGEIEPGSMGDARITADQPALDQFMASPEGAGLFTEKFAELTKVD
jgi:hypothetical protein